jgi:hypothetical protein
VLSVITCSTPFFVNYTILNIENAQGGSGFHCPRRWSVSVVSWY